MKRIVQSAKDLMYERRRDFHKNKSKMKKNFSIDLGDRHVFFVQTFEKADTLIKEVFDIDDSKNRILVYVHYPQVLLHKSKDNLEIDPSYCCRLDFAKYQEPKRRNKKVDFRMLKDTDEDVEQVNAIYEKYNMPPIDRETVRKNQYSPGVNYYVAEVNGRIVGSVIGLNHYELFRSAEKGSSLWGLAVAPGTEGRGIGKLLVNYLVGHYHTKGLKYMDLYVDYYNKRAFHLYQKLGFRRISRFYLVPKEEAVK